MFDYRHTAARIILQCISNTDCIVRRFFVRIHRACTAMYMTLQFPLRDYNIVYMWYHWQFPAPVTRKWRPHLSTFPRRKQTKRCDAWWCARRGTFYSIVYCSVCPQSAPALQVEVFIGSGNSRFPFSPWESHGNGKWTMYNFGNGNGNCYAGMGGNAWNEQMWKNSRTSGLA